LRWHARRAEKRAPFERLCRVVSLGLELLAESHPLQLASPDHVTTWGHLPLMPRCACCLAYVIVAGTSAWRWLN
jgi:hypothetical protein